MSKKKRPYKLLQNNEKQKYGIYRMIINVANANERMVRMVHNYEFTII